jgi:glycosyltransferase involved in cell wall biosynthesis
VVPNGVDAAAPPPLPGGESALAPAVRAVLARRPLLLFLGRISWKKGLDRLVAALAQVPGATLALAGNDEEGYGARLERLAADAGVAGRVVRLGAVHGADKAALLRGADALVLASYSENFGNVVLEAMAAGLPVAVTPEVGVADLVRERGAGVVTAGDPPRLAAALRGLLADPELRRDMGRRGAAAALRDFGWAPVAARMEQVYAEVLAAGSGGAP